MRVPYDGEGIRAGWPVLSACDGGHWFINEGNVLMMQNGACRRTILYARAIKFATMFSAPFACESGLDEEGIHGRFQ